MSIKKLPNWLISGVVIIPVLFVFGLILYIISAGKINFLFWMTIPSIIFEEMFETCYREFSDSQFANLIFIILFWFVIGATTGWLTKTIKK